MLRYLYLLIGLLACANSAQAQMGGGGMGDAVYIPDVDEESLILLRPDKWYPFFSESEQKVDTFYFPTGQEPDDWKEALQSQRYFSTMGVTDAVQVYELRVQASAQSCAEHEVTLISDAAENGYSRAEWAEICVQQDGSDLTTLNKVILGNEQLYTIKKVWKYTPGKRDIEEWQEYVSQVYVCDPNTGRNPCRPPGAAGEGMGGGRP